MKKNIIFVDVGAIDKLKFSKTACTNCQLDLSDKKTDHIEHGYNEQGQPIVTGFCPRCGRGFPMITENTQEKVTPEIEKVKPPEIKPQITVRLKGNLFQPKKPVKKHTKK